MVSALFAAFRFSCSWELGYGIGTKGAGGAGILQTSGKLIVAPPPLLDFIGNIINLLLLVGMVSFHRMPDDNGVQAIFVQSDRKKRVKGRCRELLMADPRFS
jgi:hypothetical protein